MLWVLFEHPKQMFKLMDKKIIAQIFVYQEACDKIKHIYLKEEEEKKITDSGARFLRPGIEVEVVKFNPTSHPVYTLGKLGPKLNKSWNFNSSFL